MRIKKLDYKARMKMGVRKRDFVTFRLELEYRPLSELFKEAVQGKTHRQLGLLIQKFLEVKEAGFEEVRELSPFLTEKGKATQSKMFNRKVDALWLDYQRKGV